jgi:hypothetical protein
MGLMNVEKEMIWYCDLVEKAGDAEIISKKQPSTTPWAARADL